MNIYNLLKKFFSIFIITTILITVSLFISVYPSSVINAESEELYPSLVLMTLKSEGETIEEDNYFELIDRQDYVLLPLISLSRWLKIDLDYQREEKVLNVYNPETEKTVQVDLKQNNYPDFPEWQSEKPLELEGDFYVSSNLIEYLTETEVEWLPSRQELIIEVDELDKISEDEEEKEISESQIKTRPEKKEPEPEVTGLDFSLGSIHYKIGFDYNTTDDFTTTKFNINNVLNLHGRAGNWTFSGSQNLQYNIRSDEYFLNYPLLRIKNTANDRLFLIGDTKFKLPQTLGNINLRGFYFQYPNHQLSSSRAYTTVTGNAEPGSTVYLYVNQKLIQEKYIYQGENSYHFSEVPLTINRTNTLKIVIEDIKGEEKVITKKVAGSLNIFPDHTNQGFFALGKYRESPSENQKGYLAGLQIKNSLSPNNSVLWELGLEKPDILIQEDENISLESILRLSSRSNKLPLVGSLELLMGGEIEFIEYGAQASLLYTSNRGHIKSSLSYVPPRVSNSLNINRGLRLKSNFQQQISPEWVFDLQAEHGKNIPGRSEFEINQGTLSFSYRDKLSNRFSTLLGAGTKDEYIYYEDYNFMEKKRNWLNLNLQGKINRNTTTAEGEVDYEITEINTVSPEEKIYERKGELNTSFNNHFTSKFVMGSGLNLKGSQFSENQPEIKANANLLARLKLGNYTYLNASTMTENNVFLTDNDFESEETKKEHKLSLKYFDPRNFTITSQLKNSFHNALEDDYYSGKLGLSYNNQKKDREFALNLEYLTPIGSREIAQQKASLSLGQHLGSGLEASLKVARNYTSLFQEKPTYRISFGLSQVLGLAKDKVMGQKYSGNEHNSYIGGVVFLDQNGNKVRDKGEPLLEDISIYREGIKTTTDQEGYFIFENTKPGIYEVGIDMENLVTDYDIVTESKIVQIRENENIFLEFGLTMEGAISGTIFLDQDVSGTKSSEDKPLEWVQLKIEELNKSVYTKSDGSFYFEDIPLGQYTLKVVHDSLPGGMKVVNKDWQKIEITPENIFQQNIMIPVIYGSR